MEEDTFYKMAEDMENNPEMYKEYIEEDEVYDVEPDYPANGKYLLVNHNPFSSVAFNSIDDAVMWAENNLDHNHYNVYKLQVVL
tara:strand:- start:343 stop:594 length:252 start_codon:yes stop_codon:yes gene_type:complete